MDAEGGDRPGARTVAIGPVGVGPVGSRNRETGSLLARGAEALFGDGDLATSRELFEAAYAEAERTGDINGIAVATLGLGGLWVHEHRTLAGGGQLRARLRHALSLVEPASSLALQLRVRLAAETDYRAGDHQAIFASLEEARRSVDPVVRAEALSVAHHCVLGPDHGARRAALAAELTEESFRTGRRSDLLMGQLWQTVDLFLGADPQARRRLAELRDMLAQRDNLAVAFVVGAIEVMLAIRAGRFAEAEEMAGRCAERGAAAGDVDWTGWYGGQLFAIRWYQGRLGELVPMLSELVHSPTLSVVDNSYFAAFAVAAAQAGDRLTASATLATLCQGGLDALPRSSTWLVTMSGIAEAAFLLGDADVAADVYDLLLPFAHLPAMASLGIACFGSVHNSLGISAMITGDLDRAVDHLRAAVRANLALAHWPAVAMSRRRYARALALAGRSSEAARERAGAEEEARALGVTVHEPAATPSGRPLVCVRTGDSWRLEWDERVALVPSSVGMRHLAVLLANPGTEVAAVDLVSGTDAASARMSGQPVLDETAMAEYRERLGRLNADIAEHEARDDEEGAKRCRVEREWVLTELTGATGLAGRARRFPDEAERARISVGKAIRRVLVRVAQADPALGGHLRDTVRMGMFCSYEP
ncbi:hypothetical protein [Actinophytocola oryzae]|uniref:hypothetical protein n=1 Tax=Actinophytocola oryzae TaxID=502181 RepID=UPI001FBB8194|nr:hypothetical protein [Actinophytocola oryzae]